MAEQGPEIQVARTGAGTPWASGAQVEALPWVKEAAAKGVEKGWLTEDQVTQLCANMAVAASDALYERTGCIYTGQCGPVTIRPVSRPSDSDSRSWGARLSPLGWFSAWGLASSYGSAAPGIMTHYGSQEPPTIQLPYPVTEIVQVKIDGVVIPPDEYELRGFHELIRKRLSASAVPVDRWGWPTSQIMDLSDTEPGTFSVTFMFGNPPPALGIVAATKLAEFLVLPTLGDDTHYPRRITQMTRQGVSARVVDVMDFVKEGDTGIYEVDYFLRTYNPKKLRRQALVWSPDLGRQRRTAQPSLPE